MRRIFLILLFLIFLIGCKITDPFYQSDFSFDTVFVEQVDVPDTATVQNYFPIRIKGYLPNSSWKFDHFELLFVDTTLTINPIGRQDKSIEVVALVVVPFEEITSFRPSRTGILIIKVTGKTKIIERQVIIV